MVETQNQWRQGMSMRKVSKLLIACMVLLSAQVLLRADQCPLLYHGLTDTCNSNRVSCGDSAACEAEYQQCMAEAYQLYEQCLGTTTPPSCGTFPCPDAEAKVNNLDIKKSYRHQGSVSGAMPAPSPVSALRSIPASNRDLLVLWGVTGAI